MSEVSEVAEALAVEVKTLQDRLAEIKQQMRELGDDRGWRWDSLDGQREEVQAELTYYLDALF